MKLYSKSDIGKKRNENQDRIRTEALSGDAGMIILCDGMGGENAGSLASQITVDCVFERISRGFRPDIGRNSLRNLLITSVTAANSLVYNKSKQSSETRGMGTTCVSAVVLNGRAYIINIGDSRVYHVFGDCVQQVTKDHTYIRKLVEDGKITEEESRSHPDRNCITRAVGAEANITPDYFELDLQESSVLLLCSDGLHAYGDDAEIAEIIISYPISTVCDALINYALEKGGKDNITVGIIAN